MLRTPPRGQELKGTRSLKKNAYLPISQGFQTRSIATDTAVTKQLQTAVVNCSTSEALLKNMIKLTTATIASMMLNMSLIFMFSLRS